MNIFLLFLHFFLNPQINQYSDEYIHLKLEMSSPIWELLDLMLVEYADKTEIIQKILKSMTFSLMMYLTREHGKQQNQEQEKSAADEMILRIEKYLSSASLGSLSAHFGYHPNYIYAMLHKKTGKAISELLLSFCMQRAELLLKNTDLSEENRRYDLLSQYFRFLLSIPLLVPCLSEGLEREACKRRRWNTQCPKRQIQTILHQIRAAFMHE